MPDANCVPNHMATWFDIEAVLDTLEEQDKTTLEKFARVQPPPSPNPSFHRRFDHAQERIRRRLSQIESEELHLSVSSQENSNGRSDDRWYKKPVGLLIIGVTVATSGLIIRAVLMRCFPQWFR